MESPPNRSAQKEASPVLSRSPPKGSSPRVSLQNCLLLETVTDFTRKLICKVLERIPYHRRRHRPSSIPAGNLSSPQGVESMQAGTLRSLTPARWENMLQT